MPYKIPIKFLELESVLRNPSSGKQSAHFYTLKNKNTKIKKIIIQVNSHLPLLFHLVAQVFSSFFPISFY